MSAATARNRDASASARPRGIKLRHLEIIDSVLQTGTLSAAARLLNISQPSASKHLQHAELVLGYALFRRRAGRLSPTPELLQLAPSIRAAYASFDEVRRLADNLRERPQERLRIGIVPAMSVHVPTAFRELTRRHRDVRCEFLTGHHHELAQWLLLREIDLAIAFDPPEHPAISTEDLGRIELVCAARAELFGKHRGAERIDAAALASMQIIELLTADPVGQLVASYARRFGWMWPAKVAVKTHSLALQLAAEGVGVAVVDVASARGFQPALQVIPLAPEALIPVKAMLLHQDAPSAALVHFLKAYRAAMSAGATSGVSRAAPASA
jgi:DNA-binding transcriptional LysR family regulator